LALVQAWALVRALVPERARVQARVQARVRVYPVLNGQYFAVGLPVYHFEFLTGLDNLLPGQFDRLTFHYKN
jgi:hypothetical protein